VLQAIRMIDETQVRKLQTKTQGENSQKHRAKKHTLTWNNGKGNKGPTKSTLKTFELIQLQALWYIKKSWTSPHVHFYQ